MSTTEIDAADYAALMAEETPSKYRNKRTARIIDGKEVKFHSEMEARRYDELELMVTAGKITDLLLQPPFDLHVNGVKICRYYADFEYRDTATGNLIVEDVKGVRTGEYRLKKKHLKAEYGIEITEVTA